MDKIAKSMIVKAVGTSIVFSTLLYLTDNIILSVASIPIVWLVRLLGYDVPNLIRLKEYDQSPWQYLGYAIRSLRPIWSKHRHLKSLIILSLPMGLASTLITLNTNVPRYIIEWSGGVVDLGTFTILSYPLLAGNTIMTALFQASLPRLARHYSEDAKIPFVHLLTKILVIAAVLAGLALIFAIFTGETFLRIAFGQQYASENGVFLVLVMGTGIGFLNWGLNSGMQAMRTFRSLLMIQLVVFCLTLFTSFAVIPGHGILGAAWVVAAAAFLQVVFKAVFIILRLQAMGFQSVEPEMSVRR